MSPETGDSKGPDGVAPAASPPEPALLLRGISKHFGGVQALSDLALEIEEGEVHALVGQNGCGKSTLVKVLTGYHAPEHGGEVRFWGEPVSLPVRNPLGQGVAVIHQALALVGEISVLENLSVGANFGTGFARPIRWRSERKRARELLKRFGLKLDLEMTIDRVSPGERAMLAVVRAVRQIEELERDRALFILDEPTVYLNRAEADRLGDLIRGLASAGSSIIYISHRLAEVRSICDRITVMRSGRVVATVDPAETDEEAILRLMTGRDIGSFYPSRETKQHPRPVLHAREVSGATVRGVSFSLHSGEVLGCTGLVGMGQDELPYLLFDPRGRRAGEVELDGDRAGQTLTPRSAVKLGVALSPADRLTEGGWSAGTALENATLPVLGSYFKRGRLELRREGREVGELLERFSVSPPNPRLDLTNFSGGNQQKVLLAKWMQIDPGILLLHEPTQGVDAAAKKEILEMITAAAEAGAGVLVCSSDYEQLAHICDRVLIFQDGQLSGELQGDDINEDSIVEVCHAI